MNIIAIDPGNVRSAYVVYATETGWIFEKNIEDNEWLADHIADLADVGIAGNPTHLAYEMIGNMGMAVGKTVHETNVWIGEFRRAWRPRPFAAIYRHEVKMCLCGHPRAKDSNIRQAIIDRYPATGGGKIPQIGTKKQPGPLYGVRADIWSALAIAITWAETRENHNVKA